MLNDLTIFAGAGARMQHASERHKLVTGNIANASTPGYVGRDLREFRLTDIPLTTRATRRSHLNGGDIDDPFAPLREPVQSTVFDETINHNTVSVEQEMVKATQALNSHAMASAVWQKSLDLLRLSLGTKAGG